MAETARLDTATEHRQPQAAPRKPNSLAETARLDTGPWPRSHKPTSTAKTPHLHTATQRRRPLAATEGANLDG